jgi:Protein of unknown function (DUF3093)
MTEGQPVPRTTYTERMPVPVMIWVAVLAFWALFSLAMAATFGPWVGLVLLLVGAAGLVVGLRAASGLVEVTPTALVAGRASLPLAAVGATVTLDAAAARLLRGTGADTRAYLYLRSWVPTAVRVDVVDATDPTPYWYVSTRRPAALVAVLEAARPPLGG